MSSHIMMILFVIMGYSTVLAVIIIAVFEAKRTKEGKKSLLDSREENITDKR